MELILMVFLFVTVFIATESIILRKRGSNPKEALKDSVDSLKTKDGINEWIGRKQLKLNRTGADFFIKDKISVGRWYVYKILFGALMYCIFLIVTKIVDLSFAPLISVVGFILGFFLLDIHLFLKNKKSNDEMMSDIMEMSRSVLYGARGGQYISEALSDAVLVVENKRLKKEMIKMKMGLASGESIEACLDEFEDHFSNAEINAFVTVIKSLISTGQLDEALKTLESNITREQSGVNKRRLTILENKTLGYVMLVAFDILLVLLYCIIMRVLDLQIAL